MIGAVVGTQPFGGFGLSGTGPKAGGPHYLSRFMREQALTVNTAAAGGNATPDESGETGRTSRKEKAPSRIRGSVKALTKSYGR